MKSGKVHKFEKWFLGRLISFKTACKYLMQLFSLFPKPSIKKMRKWYEFTLASRDSVLSFKCQKAKIKIVRQKQCHSFDNMLKISNTELELVRSSFSI